MLAFCVVVAAVAIAAGCGESSDGGTIALLVPGKYTSRNEVTVRPNFEAKVLDGCPECEVVYRDAGGDFSKQKQLAKVLMSEGIDVLVLNPVYGGYGSVIIKEAEAADVPVVNYGQLLVGAKPDVFVSFNDVRNGELQTEMLAKKLKKDGKPRGPVVMLNGEPGNSDEHLFQEGARHGLQVARVKIAKHYFIPFWQASQAQREMRHAIKLLGKDGFAGVYAETDGIAEGAIAAMREASIDPSERPTTGRGVTPASVRRILLGEQYLTIYQPVESEASVSGEIAADLAEGEEVPQGKITTTLKNGKFQVPSILLEPIPITKANMKPTVIADDLISTSELCAGRVKQACKEAGISVEG